MPAVYVAGPLGFTLPTRTYYESVLLPTVAAAGWEVLDPWSASAAVFDAAFAVAPGPDLDAALLAANRSAGATNEGLIRRADGVLAVLDGVDVDSGTAAEIGFAAALAKPVVGWRSDHRAAGENPQSVINLQVEHWLTGPVHRTLQAAIDGLTEALR